MPEFVASIANLPIVGEDFTNIPNGAATRNLIHVRLGRLKATLVQHPQVVVANIAELSGQSLYTTDLKLGNVPEKDTQWAVNIAIDLAWLLSFVTMSDVGVFRWRHGSRVEGWQIQGSIRYFRPVLLRSDGAEIRHFLEVCWPQYRLLKRARKLPAVIHYCLQAERPEATLEYQLLGTFVVLENLKATFARSKGIPYVKGHFRHSPKPNAPTYSFKDLLGLMFKEIGMRVRLQRIVALRNEIVHFGLSN